MKEVHKKILNDDEIKHKNAASKFGLYPIFDKEATNRLNYENPSLKHLILINKVKTKFKRNLMQFRKIRELYETEQKYIKVLKVLDEKILDIAK